MSRTEISTLGEFGLIDRINKSTKINNPSTFKGIGDDAAVIKTGDICQLISTDMLVENIHFDLSYCPLPHLGYKSVAVNVSDIAAMNGIPEQITVSLALSNRFSVEAIDALYQGIFAACQDYNVDLVGGDTTSSPSGLVISITAIGKAKPSQITYRNQAKKGDILCVTGDLGAAFIGLKVLQMQKVEFQANPQMQPSLEGKEYVVRRQLKPSVRMDIVHELAELGIKPTAMIDISDGLASEIRHIATQSGVGAMVYEDKLPIDKETYEVAINTFQLTPSVCALNGGEDYELLFTIDQNDYEKIKTHEDISLIGYMTEGKEINLITTGGQKVPLSGLGWNHF
jgi:thiamine-monophosphate kinase